MTKKKRSLRNEKLKANRASETEEQRKEILRIRHENDRARRITKKKTQEGNKRSSETEDHEKQSLATPRLKRSDENEWGSSCLLSLNLMILRFIIIHNTLGTFFLSYVNILSTSLVFI